MSSLYKSLFGVVRGHWLWKLWSTKISYHMTYHLISILFPKLTNLTPTHYQWMGAMLTTATPTCHHRMCNGNPVCSGWRTCSPPYGAPGWRAGWLASLQPPSTSHCQTAWSAPRQRPAAQRETWIELKLYITDYWRLLEGTEVYCRDYWRFLENTKIVFATSGSTRYSVSIYTKI